MEKKMLKKQRIAIQKLEERVLFDAAGAAEIVDAAAAAAAFALLPRFLSAMRVGDTAAGTLAAAAAFLGSLAWVIAWL